MSITEISLPYFKFHSLAPPVFLKSKIKNGAPMIAVRIETGISAAVAALDAVSIATINAEPRPMLTGITFRLSLPYSILAA